MPTTHIKDNSRLCPLLFYAVFLSLMFFIILFFIFEFVIPEYKEFIGNVYLTAIALFFGGLISWLLVMNKPWDWEVIEKAGYYYFPDRAPSDAVAHFYGKWKKKISIGIEIIIEPFSPRFGTYNYATLRGEESICTYREIVFIVDNPSKNTFNFWVKDARSQEGNMKEKIGAQAFSMLQTDLIGVVSRISAGEHIIIVAYNDPKVDRIKILEEFILSIRMHLASR